MQEKTTLEKLHGIEKQKIIYDIHYCNAGIGFIFFEGNRIKDPIPDIRKIAGEKIDMGWPKNWREGLVTYKYYPTFEKAVEAEYEKLIGEKNARNKT